MQSLDNCFTALKQKNFHKLIIGAALKDFEAIEDYAYLYTRAKIEVIDISAFPSSVISAQKGIKKALSEDSSLIAPLLMVSINTSQDPHFRRVEVDYQICTECMQCIPSCPANAFSEIENKFHYNINLCYGCSDCIDYCPFSALEFKTWSNFKSDSLQELQVLGARAIEYHLGENPQEFKDFYLNLANHFELESFCIGSELYGKDELKESCKLVIDSVLQKHGEGYQFIIQVDGMPQSGAKQIDQNKKDQSCFEAATIVTDLVNKSYPKLSKNIFVQVAGGINNQSLKKAHESGLNINGVAIGSFARKQITNWIEQGFSKEKLIKSTQKMIQESKIG